jgi:hypothetical protein
MIIGTMRCLRRANSLRHQFTRPLIASRTTVGLRPSPDRNQHAQREQDRVASSGRWFVESKMDRRRGDHDDAQSNCSSGRQDGRDTSGVRKHQTDNAEDLAQCGESHQRDWNVDDASHSEPEDALLRLSSFYRC